MASDLLFVDSTENPTTLSDELHLLDEGETAETGPTALTDGQEILLSMLMVVSGLLSILGSSTIVYKVVNNRGRSKPYDRLMLGLSSCDIVASLAYVLSPFLLPKATSHRVWAIGGNLSCTFLGFLTQFAFSGLWYNCCLSFYYLLTVRFGVKRIAFGQKYEFWMHLSCICFNLITASFGATVGMYGELELNLGCWISYYPEGCQYDDSCIGSYYAWGMAGLPVVFTMFAIPINNLIIYCHVRKSLHNAAQEGSDNQPQDERALRQQVQIREVSSQGFLYVATFMLCFLPAFIVRVLEAEPVLLSAEDEPRFFWLLALHNFLLPLQGLLNMFVYTRPSYIRFRGAHPEQNTFWAIKRACLDGDIPRLTESRWTSSNMGGSARSFRSGKRRRIPKSAESKSGSNFSSNLDIVEEASDEDKDSTSFQDVGANVKVAYWDTWKTQQQQQQHSIASGEEHNVADQVFVEDNPGGGSSTHDPTEDAADSTIGAQHEPICPDKIGTTDQESSSDELDESLTDDMDKEHVMEVSMNDSDDMAEILNASKGERLGMDGGIHH